MKTAGLQSPENSLTPLGDLARAVAYIVSKPTFAVGGQVTEIEPGCCEISGLSQWLTLNDCVMIESENTEILAQVLRIEKDKVIVKPYQSQVLAGIGAKAWLTQGLMISPHHTWRGRVVNAFGQPIDGGRWLEHGAPRSIENTPPSPLTRGRVEVPVKTGVRIVDVFTPLCEGQRLGIFGGSGVGKSTLLAMLCQGHAFETAVVALVGERGREVREIIEDVFGSRLDKVVAVVATSDESALMRALAPRSAMAIAEYFRDMGQSVLLIVDSVTRYAHALREVSLAAGEPPVARGYPPSIFSHLARLLERAGPGTQNHGSITGIFSVLVDGDNHNEPVADALRGILDGHVVLDRAISDEGRYPAINVLSSISRLATKVWTPDQKVLVRELKRMISKVEETKDLRMIAGHRPGVDPDLDRAILLVPKIYRALCQTLEEEPAFDAYADVLKALKEPESNPA